MTQDRPTQELSFKHSMSPVTEDGIVRCKCDLAAKHLISRTEANPGRGFYKCPKDDKSKCKFFAWADELDLQLLVPVTPAKRPLQPDGSITLLASSPSVTVMHTRGLQQNENLFSDETQFGSSPDTLIGSPTKKLKLSDAELATPIGSQTSVISALGSSDQRESEGQNPFIDHNDSPLPPNSIFATPSSSGTTETPIRRATEEIRAAGHEYIEAICAKLAKIEKREIAAQQQNTRLRDLLESERRKNVDLLKRVAELEKTISDLTMSKY